MACGAGHTKQSLYGISGFQEDSETGLIGCQASGLMLYVPACI
jgi:hypothetical protein